MTNSSASPIRICIDGTPLLVRSAGVKTYLYHWLQALQSAGTSHRIEIFPNIKQPSILNHERSIGDIFSTGLRLASIHALNMRRHWPAWLDKSVDLFHASTLARSTPRRAKLTATIHDLTTWLMPEVHSRANIEADRGFAAAVLTKADRLIAVSENTKNDAIKVLKLPADKIEVIHHGVPPEYFRVDSQAAQAAANKYCLARPYVFFCSTLEPRKNVALLLDAYESLPSDIRDHYDLVLTGMNGWKSQAITDRLRRSGRGVRYLGYVPEEDLPALMKRATVFVYPSLYEGFGLPLAQAMAAAVPSITANVSALPEIAGDTALLIDPRSRAELTEAMTRLLTSPSLRSDQAGRAQQRAEQFRWETAAAKSLAFFERTMGG